MNNLTREETVWLQAYKIAKKKLFWTDALLEADQVLGSFKHRFPKKNSETICSIPGHIRDSETEVCFLCTRFPTPTAEDKPAVNSVKGVYVTREMLATAFNKQWAWDGSKYEKLTKLCLELGLSE